MAIAKIDYESKEKQKEISESLYGKTVYLLGTSEFGATNKPTLIQDEATLYKIFGNKGSLISGYKEVKKGYPDGQVFLCKTSGTHSILHLDVNVKGGNIVRDGFIIKAKDSNEIYNNIKLTINENSFIFEYPDELGGGSKEYKYEDYEILGMLAKKINEDTNNEGNFVYAQCMVDPATPIYGSLNTTNPTEIYMYGGDNGLLYCKNLYYNCLEKTYELIEGEDIDVIVPLEAFLDDILPLPEYYGSKPYNSLFYQEDRDYLNITLNDGRKASYYEQLLLFCIRQMRFGSITHGVMGFNKTPDKYLYNNKKNYLLEVIEYALKSNITNLELQSYQFLISVVAGDLTYEYGMKVNNGYTFYAGLISSLSVATSTTNKPLHESVYIYNEFDNDDLYYLSEKGVVTFRESPLIDRAVVLNGVTTSHTGSDLHFLCNIRMVQLTAAYIKDQFQSYIGEDINSLIDTGIAEANLNSLLNLLNKMGILTGFKAHIIKDDAIGCVTYHVHLKTVYMTEFVTVTGGINYKVR